MIMSRHKITSNFSITFTHISSNPKTKHNTMCRSKYTSENQYWKLLYINTCFITFTNYKLFLYFCWIIVFTPQNKFSLSVHDKLKATGVALPEKRSYIQNSTHSGLSQPVERWCRVLPLVCLDQIFTGGSFTTTFQSSTFYILSPWKGWVISSDTILMFI